MSKLVETIVGLVVENSVLMGMWGIMYTAFKGLISHEAFKEQVDELIETLVGHTLGWWNSEIKEYLRGKVELRGIKSLIRKEKRELKHKKKLKDLEEELKRVKEREQE